MLPKFHKQSHNLQFINGDLPDIVWIGWRILNLLRIAKTAVTGGSNKTAQAMLAAALQ